MTENSRPQRRLPQVTRRTFLAAAGGLVGTAIVGCGVVESVRGRQVSTIGEVEFGQPLAIPPLVESTVDGEGGRVFDLTAQAGQSEFFRGQATETWGINGAYLGPTLRASRGERVQINVHNALDEVSTLHWHGMHLPAEADGGPHQMIDPGETWSPSWEVGQPAATLWYHPHPAR